MNNKVELGEKIGQPLLLTCLQEECAEVIMAVSKIKRFGNRAWGNNPSNPDLLAAEVGTYWESLMHWN
jgi:hypothetical protein